MNYFHISFSSKIDKKLNYSKFSTGYTKNSCYQNIAKSKQDLSICENIGEPKSKSDCILGVAIQKEDVGICKNVDYGERYYCIKEIAKLKNDPSVCKSIDDESYRDFCIQELR